MLFLTRLFTKKAKHAIPNTDHIQGSSSNKRLRLEKFVVDMAHAQEEIFAIVLRVTTCPATFVNHTYVQPTIKAHR